LQRISVTNNADVRRVNIANLLFGGALS
jgi:hypothetical protein